MDCIAIQSLSHDTALGKSTGRAAGRAGLAGRRWGVQVDAQGTQQARRRLGERGARGAQAGGRRGRAGRRATGGECAAGRRWARGARAAWALGARAGCGLCTRCTRPFFDPF